jgi:molybdenum cofactor cytidylyltransferase
MRSTEREVTAGETLIIAGLVPAAGASRRLGQDKRLLPLRGATLLEATVASLRGGGVEPVVVILEPDSPCRALPGLRDVILAVNPAPERGMLSSIRAGLVALPATAAAAAVLPGDHAFVPSTAVAALVAEFARVRQLLLAPRFTGQRGHPLVLARALFAEAAACDDHVGLRQLVERRVGDLLELAVDVPGADDDLDLPQHLSRLDREPR